MRGFIQCAYTEYTGDDTFLAGPTERTLRVWKTLSDMFPQEREKGVYDIDWQTPATITSHAPGYISEDDNVIVGLQTDAPLKRAIMPYGGWRMVVKELETYGYPVDPNLEHIFSTYRKTHNDGVFDAYPPNVRAARSSHIVTGLPDAYGRGRIIGDYRRVALYGVDALIKAKKLDRIKLDMERSSEDIIRDREENSEQIKALGELKQMAASYGFDISKPAHQHQGSRPVAVLRLPGSGQGAERRGHVARPHLDLPRLLRQSVTSRRAPSPSPRPRRSSTTSSSSSASCASSAPPSTTRCSRATRCGSPSRSPEWARTAARWSPRTRSASCTRSTTSARRPSRT